MGKGKISTAEELALFLVSEEGKGQLDALTPRLGLSFPWGEEDFANRKNLNGDGHSVSSLLAANGQWAQFTDFIKRCRWINTKEWDEPDQERFFWRAWLENAEDANGQENHSKPEERAAFLALLSRFEEETLIALPLKATNHERKKEAAEKALSFGVDLCESRWRQWEQARDSSAEDWPGDALSAMEALIQWAKKSDVFIMDEKARKGLIRAIGEAKPAAWALFSKLPGFDQEGPERKAWINALSEMAFTGDVSMADWIEEAGRSWGDIRNPADERGKKKSLAIGEGARSALEFFWAADRFGENEMRQVLGREIAQPASHQDRSAKSAIEKGIENIPGLRAAIEERLLRMELEGAKPAPSPKGLSL